ncbi:MAG: heavy metal-binding domain-containing protein [Candidatus Gastranaerophilales bacterium]|nr:heavy metal-binding domain-containing protein [Candidatus Gastranaerophilales bacterium]
MQCKNCGKDNSSKHKHCIKCGKKLEDTVQAEEYCLDCKSPLLYPDKPCPYCNGNEIQNKETCCNDCKSNLRTGILFNDVRKLDDLERIILEIDSSKVFCEKCIKSQKVKATEKLDTLKLKFNKFITQMPVITLQKPIKPSIVKYCGVVTSQSAVSVDELNDLSGKSSEFNLKLNLGEKFCINSIKKEALKQGANAIIGCDIEYAELSNPMHTFMIAMMGTAVILKGFEVLSEYERNIFVRTSTG